MEGADQGGAPGASRDAQDVAATLAGDPTAFDALVDRYKTRVYGVVYNILQNHDDAWDVTQEAFLKAYKSLHGYHGKSNFYTWLYRIAVNHAINYRKKRKDAVSVPLTGFEDSIERDPAYEELIVQEKASKDAVLGELKEKLNESLSKLSKEHRAVVVLHDIEGLHHKEIAKILKCSEGTVRSRLHYAHLQLQSLLSNYLKR
ncbi:MAG: sigma-70 family RNA polymerase sigma factor [Verrucomicrobiae bacterium]|nr:sigma-70 family RNA polymerase sigma factor [Verrucomicrobiae bacterium]